MLLAWSWLAWEKSLRYHREDELGTISGRCSGEPCRRSTDVLWTSGLFQQKHFCRYFWFLACPVSFVAVADTAFMGLFMSSPCVHSFGPSPVLWDTLWVRLWRKGRRLRLLEEINLLLKGDYFFFLRWVQCKEERETMLIKGQISSVYTAPLSKVVRVLCSKWVNDVSNVYAEYHTIPGKDKRFCKKQGHSVGNEDEKPPFSCRVVSLLQPRASHVGESMLHSDTQRDTTEAAFLALSMSRPASAVGAVRIKWNLFNCFHLRSTG